MAPATRIFHLLPGQSLSIFAGMSQEKLTSPLSILVDLAIAGVFFIAMTFLLRDFVPAENPIWVWFFAAFTAFPIAAVFFLATQMFRVTIVDQLRRKKAENQS